jgi:hypothetical protein
MFRLRYILFCVLLASAFSARAVGTNSLVWHKSADRVDADIHGEALWPLLEQIAEAADWKVFVEPGAEHNASAKFKNLPSGDALKMLLGDLNFALVPQTNASSLLYVFRTTMQNATKPVRVAKAAKRVSNQLLIRVKPGTDINALAKLVGAKVIGRMDKLGVYLLQFGDAAATDAALAQLKSNSDVLAVDYNYYFDPPPSVQPISSSSVPSSAGPVTLKPNPPTPGDPCSPIVGLIDTSIQSQSLGNLNQSMLPAISAVGDSGSGASAQSIWNPVALFTPKQTAAAGGIVYPTHGTAMAYTIFNAVSQASGGSSSVRILPVDVYGTGETTTSWNVALGVQAAVNNGATVLNMSLGGSGDSSVLDSVIQQAMASGIIVFAAAGNTPVNTPTYPAAIPGVNDVTALGSPGQLASYANFSPQVDMALPGASVVYLANQSYLVQGTSSATAYASGMAAGTKSVNCLTWQQILSAMQTKFPVPTK